MAFALNRFIGCLVDSLPRSHTTQALIITTCLFGGVGALALPLAVQRSQRRHRPRIPSRSFSSSSSPIEVEPSWDEKTRGTPPSFTCPLRQWDAVVDMLSRPTPPFFDFASLYERHILQGRETPLAIRLAILTAIHTPSEAVNTLLFTPPTILTALATALARSMCMSSLISLLACAARVLDNHAMPFARKLTSIGSLRERVQPGISMIFHEALLVDAWLRSGIDVGAPPPGFRCTRMVDVEVYVSSGAIPDSMK